MKDDQEAETPDDEYSWTEEIALTDFTNDTKTATGARILHTVKLDITTTLGQKLPWNGLETRSDLAPTSRDPQCFEKIRTWIQECKLDHPQRKSLHSSQDGDNLWPKRLVDTGPLGDEPSLKLVEDVSNVDCCSLSYCWGEDPDKNFTMTAATIDQRRKHIPMSDLPRAFRDVVIITREVGCRYVWVSLFRDL